MISTHPITVVFQGELRANTVRAVAHVRALMPQATLVFATCTKHDGPEWDRLRQMVEHAVVVDDPGALPPSVRSPTAPANNINRMLRSTQAGLGRVTSSHVLKLRSDAHCDPTRIVAAWNRACLRDGRPRLAFASRYTRHPQGISGYTFHPSDWITFGRTVDVTRYWSAPLFDEEQACWFDTHDVHDTRAGLTATARRFRARFTQEQWLCCRYAAELGYRTPQDAHDRCPAVVNDYARFLAERCLVLDVQDIRLHVPSQAFAERSTFQDLDCVSQADWEVLAGWRPRDRGRELRRRMARLLRHPIARMVLLRKWLQKHARPVLGSPCRAGRDAARTHGLHVPRY